MVSDKKKQEITKDDALELGITEDEWDLILPILGRSPTEYEALVFRVIWSDEFSRVYSKELVKLFHTETEQYKNEIGSKSSIIALDENISLVINCSASLGGLQLHYGLGIRAEIESAFSNLWQFGARPLWFSISSKLGQLSNIEHAKIYRSMLLAASDYSRKIGVPLAKLDYFFEAKFKLKPVLNIFSLGLVDNRITQVGEIDRSVLLESDGETEVSSSLMQDYVLCYIGAQVEPLPRGAKKQESIASGGSKLGYMMIGDPVTALYLSGAVSDAISSGKVHAVQRIEKGGILGALFIVSMRMGQAFEIQLDRFPAANQNLSAKEVLFNELAGRFLVVTSKENYRSLHEVFDKWKLKITVVGNTTSEHSIRISWKHSDIIDVPVKRVFESLVFHKYELLSHPPMLKENPRHAVEESTLQLASDESDTIESEEVDLQDEESEDRNLSTKIDIPAYLNDTWIDLLGNPAFADRSRLYDLFDCNMSSTIFPGFRKSSIARICCSSGEKLVVTALVSKPLFLAADRYLGAAHTIAESVRHLSCVGATPLALASCFNVGNPRNYKELCDISEILRGAGDAARYWKIPVASEDLNLLTAKNERFSSPSMCALSIGLVGDRSNMLTCSFQKAGDMILLLTDMKCEIECTEYSYYCHQHSRGRLPDLNFEYEIKINSFVRDLVRCGLLKSCSAVGAGGLAVALSEGCLTSRPPLGAEFFVNTKINAKDFRPDAMLFSETIGRFLITCSPECESKIRLLCKENGIFIGGEGRVGGKEISFKSPISCSISLLTAYKVWSQGIQPFFGEE